MMSRVISRDGLTTQKCFAKSFVVAPPRLRRLTSGLITPKALANFSPGLELRQPWVNQSKKKMKPWKG